MQRLISIVRDVPTGFRYLPRGVRALATHPRWWPIILIPLVVNLVLFSGFVVFVGEVMRRFLATNLPDSWWGLLFAGMIMLVSMLFILFLSLPLFTVIATAIASPFYDLLATRVLRSLGEVPPEISWKQELVRGLRLAFLLFGWYLAIQGAIIALFFLPIVNGPFTSTALGFLATAGFLGVEYVSFSPRFRSWTFPKQRQWCMDRKGLVAGFGTATALALAVPGLNLVIPPAAIVGGLMLLHEHDGEHGGHFRKI